MHLLGLLCLQEEAIGDAFDLWMHGTVMQAQGSAVLSFGRVKLRIQESQFAENTAVCMKFLAYIHSQIEILKLQVLLPKSTHAHTRLCHSSTVLCTG